MNSLSEIIAKLQEKKDYYQKNFSGPESNTRDREERVYENDKKPKHKYEKKEKLRLELADFPALA